MCHEVIGNRPLSQVTASRALACFIFRLLRRPQEALQGFHSPDSVQRAEKVIADHLAAAREPLRAGEIFGRRHDQHFEMGDGAAVHSIVLERIAESRELAMAVANAPGKRYATPDMLAKAEEVTGIRALAADAARRQGYEPREANREEGAYSGSVIAVTDRYVVQDIGMRTAVLHHRDDLMFGKALKVGDQVHVSYRAGAAIVRERAQAHAGVPGR